MNMNAYVDEIKLNVTGGLLDIEIGDDVIQRIVEASMRELQRYICSTKILTIPYSKCIDLSDYHVNSVARVYRAAAAGLSINNGEGSVVDPVQMGLIQVAYNTGSMYNFSDYVSNYLSYSTLQQMRNTMSTDLSWYYEDAKKLLYINTALDSSVDVTIEFVPRYNDVSEITSDFWIDVLMRLATSLTKVALGRIRSRYTQSNALWQQDGATMLQEGQQELAELRAYLQKNTNLVYPID